MAEDAEPGSSLPGELSHHQFPTTVISSKSAMLNSHGHEPMLSQDPDAMPSYNSS